MFLCFSATFIRNVFRISCNQSFSSLMEMPMFHMMCGTCTCGIKLHNTVCFIYSSRCSEGLHFSAFIIKIITSYKNLRMYVFTLYYYYCYVLYRSSVINPLFYTCRIYLCTAKTYTTWIKSTVAEKKTKRLNPKTKTFKCKINVQVYSSCSLCPKFHIIRPPPVISLS